MTIQVVDRPTLMQRRGGTRRRVKLRARCGPLKDRRGIRKGKGVMEMMWGKDVDV